LTSQFSSSIPQTITNDQRTRHNIVAMDNYTKPSNPLLINYHDALIYESDLSLLDNPSAWLNSDCIHFRLTRLSVMQKLLKNRDAGREDSNSDLFLDPSVVSFLMHQCDEEDEDEMSDLRRAWELPQPTDVKNESAIQSKPNEIQKKRLFVPINDQYASSRKSFVNPGGGSHWSFLFWDISICQSSGTESNMVTSKFFHFDSSNGYNSRAAKTTSKKLQKVLLSFWGNAIGISSDDINLVECKTPQQTNGCDCGLFALGVAQALAFADKSSETPDASELEFIVHYYFDKIGDVKSFGTNLRKIIGDDIRSLIISECERTCNY